MEEKITNQEVNDLMQENPTAANESSVEVLIEDSKALNEQKKELSADDYQALLEKLAAQRKKVIQIPTITDHQVQQSHEIIGLLSNLKQDVIDKKNEALRQREIIKTKVDQLLQAGIVQIHQEEYKKSEESVEQYAALLNNIDEEINREIACFSMFTGAQVPESLVVWQHEADDFAVYLKDRIRAIKKYIKDIRKDLNISFSRYAFGFQAQIKRILQVEAYMRYQQAMAKQSESK